MAKFKIAPQREFKSLDDFIINQNNFHMHFMTHLRGSMDYRARDCFRRFKSQYSELERKTTQIAFQTVKGQPKREELPYEQLWEAYKVMSTLVFTRDKYVMRKNKIVDDSYLCR